MHSRIFQISTEPIDKENYLNEDTLQQGDGSFYGSKSTSSPYGSPAARW